MGRPGDKRKERAKEEDRTIAVGYQPDAPLIITAGQGIKRCQLDGWVDSVDTVLHIFLSEQFVDHPVGKDQYDKN